MAGVSSSTSMADPRVGIAALVGRPLALISALLLLAIAPAASAGDERGATALGGAEVRIGAMTVRGELDAASRVVAFRGIPFARPPIDERRWRKPEPLPTRVGVLEATQFAPACMQSGSGLAWYQDLMRRIGEDPTQFPAPAYSEDCLYLNVWSDLSDTTLRPVIVYIHGGSNTGGWSYEPNYRGQALAERGVVLVSVAYRLGVFGFLSHPDLSDRNFALHDLAMALHWVRDHIEAFGGDPTRITLMGESAGAANASHLMVSPLSQGIATRLIHQSGGWQFDAIADPALALELGSRLETAVVGQEGGLPALRRASAAAVLEAAGDVYSDFYFSPVPDQASLPATLGELAAMDALPAFDLLIGTNADEALMYIGDDATTVDWLSEHYSGREGAIRAQLDDAAKDHHSLNMLRTAEHFACPSARVASAVAAAGGRSYVYEFLRVRDGLDAIGAYHGAELPYVFATHDDWLPTGDTDRRLTEQMVARWLSFAAHGQPDDGMDPPWPLWQAESQQILFLGDEVATGTFSYVDLCPVLTVPCHQAAVRLHQGAVSRPGEERGAATCAIRLVESLDGASAITGNTKHRPRHGSKRHS